VIDLGNPEIYAGLSGNTHYSGHRLSVSSMNLSSDTGGATAPYFLHSADAGQLEYSLSYERHTCPYNQREVTMPPARPLLER
jgi:hypothetical protein